MAIFTVTNTNDSGPGSLRQAIEDSNAAGGDNTIEFDAALLGQTITLLSALPVNTSADIDGDIDGDGSANDVTISSLEDTSLFTLDVDGVDFESSATLFLDIPDTLDFPITRGAINVTADDASFTNTGDITIDGAGMFGDRVSAVQVEGDNFTFSNLGSDTTITTTARSVIETLGFDPVTFEILDLITHVVNEGTLIAQDDTVRIINGSVANSGTIRTEGTFDFGGLTGLQPGEIADGILFFGPQSDSYSGPTNLVNNTATGIIEGVRSGIFQIGGGQIDNAGLITADVTGILLQGSFRETAQDDFVLNNSGVITGGTENFGLNGPDPDDDIGAIHATTGLTDITINNTGTISDPDAVITAFSGTTVNNTGTGQLLSDIDGTGDDNVAFIGSQMDDFIVEDNISINFIAPTPELTFESSQGVTFEGSNENGFNVFEIPDGNGGTILVEFFPGDQLPLANVAGVNILALIDIADSIDSGFLSFQSDPNDDFIFPASITITSPTAGDLIVTYTISDGFSVTDTNGDLAFNVPADVNFDDEITNDAGAFIDGDIITGLGNDVINNIGVIDGNADLSPTGDSILAVTSVTEIIGDIFTGVGDDSVTNSSVITGEVFLGEGDDIFSGEGSDTSNVVFGEDGDDTLTGGSANDSLSGGDGDDLLLGSSGADMIDGGDGIDTNSFEDLGAGVRASIDRGFARSDGDRDTFVNIENLTGTNFDDGLGGDDGANVLSGLDGDDVLFGGGGDDTLYGGDGDDLLRGAEGADMIDGGDGIDTNSFQDLGAGVRASTDFGFARSDGVRESFVNIENLTGTDFDDRLGGDDGDNVLIGRDGDDGFLGEAGDDIIDGGDGFDLAVYRDVAANISIVDNGDGTFTVSSGLDGTDTLIGIEALRDGNGTIIDLTSDATLDEDESPFSSVEVDFDFAPDAPTILSEAEYDSDLIEEIGFGSNFDFDPGAGFEIA